MRLCFFFFSSRRRHTRYWRDWSSDVCSSDLATRAATLVRQLLAFWRRQTLRPQVLDLGDALSDLTMLLRRLIGEKVKLDLVHGRDLWPVKVDVSQFEQVVVNLAVNARDAMPDGGKLTVRTGNVTSEQAAALSHKGMPPADYVGI